LIKQALLGRPIPVESPAYQCFYFIFLMSLPIHVEDRQRAEKLYSDFHSGTTYLICAGVLTSLTILLAVNSIMRLVRSSTPNPADSTIFALGGIFCFGSLLVELIWQYSLARKEDIWILRNFQYRVDIGIFAWSIILFSIGLKVSGSQNVIDLLWLIPLATRGLILIAKLGISTSGPHGMSVEMT